MKPTLDEFLKSPSSFEPFGDGLGNKIYRHEDLIYREKLDCDPFYDRDNEYRIWKKADEAGLSPKLFEMDEKGNCVSSCFDGAPFLGPDSSEENLMKIGAMLKKLHSLPVEEEEDFNVAVRYIRYLNLSGAAFPVEDSERLIAAYLIRSTMRKHVICHNDLSHGNILKDKAGNMTFIDFEFAGLNDPVFDLASVLSENNLRENRHCVALLRGYLGKEPQNRDVFEIEEAVPFLDLLWFFWAKSRYKATGNETFEEIAKDKAKYLRSLSSFGS